LQSHLSVMIVVSQEFKFLFTRTIISTLSSDNLTEMHLFCVKLESTAEITGVTGVAAS